jgi:holo-[acyl-carrier protein] synthase
MNPDKGEEKNVLVDKKLNTEGRCNEESLERKAPILLWRVLYGSVFEFDAGGIGEALFLERILGPFELEECIKKDADEVWLASRFAAKEACMKALGTGWARGVGFSQMEVLEESSGSCRILFLEEAGVSAASMGCSSARVSFSSSRGLVMAFVVLESTASDLNQDRPAE